MFVYESKSNGKFFVYKTKTDNDDLIFIGEIDSVMIDLPYLECNCYVQTNNRTLIVD